MFKKLMFLLAITLIPTLVNSQPQFQIPGVRTEKERKSEGKTEDRIKEKEKRTKEEERKAFPFVDPKAMLEAAQRASREAKQKMEEQEKKMKNEQMKIDEQILTGAATIPWETFTGPCIQCGNESITYTCDTDPLNPSQGVGYIKGTSCPDSIKIGSFTSGIECETTEFAYLSAYLRISLADLCPNQDRFIVDGFVGDDSIILESPWSSEEPVVAAYDPYFGCRLTIKGGAGNDTLLGPNSGWDCLMGGEGDDVVRGSHRLWGDGVGVSPYDGKDSMKGVEGSLFRIFIVGGGDDDRIKNNGLGGGYIDGGPGNDCIDAGDNTERPMAASGGAGDDQLTGKRLTTLTGEGGNDFIVGGKYGFGSVGNDWLEKRSTTEQLWGDEGSDKLIGSHYVDYPPSVYLNGGPGSDYIAYGPQDNYQEEVEDDTTPLTLCPLPSETPPPWYCSPPQDYSVFSGGCGVD